RLSRLLSVLRTGSRAAVDRDLLARLASATSSARVELIGAFLRVQIAQVLRLPEDKIEKDAPLMSLGMDSLMGLELRNRIEAALGVTAPATLLWTYPTVATLSGHLVGQVGFRDNDEEPAQMRPPDTGKAAPPDDQAAPLDDD